MGTANRIMLRQGPGRGIAGNSRPDNRDPHFIPSVASQVTECGSRSFKSATGSVFT
jgi:hypothetical protein